MKVNSKTDKKKEPFHAWKNNKLMLGYFIRYIPAYFYAYTFYVIFVAFVTVITSSVSLKIIFDGIEQGKNFREIIYILLGISILIIVRNIWGSIMIEYLEEKAVITFKEKVRLEIFNQAYIMDTECYENTEFYNDFVWAASQADNNGFRVFATYTRLLARVSDLFFLGGVLILLKPILIIVAIAVGFFKYFMNQKVVKIHFDIESENKPFERERDYSQRIFYLNDYAKEVRLTNIHKVIYKRFINANEQIRNNIDEKSGKALKIGYLSSFIQQLFLTLGILLYLTYEIMVTKNISVGDFAALSIAIQQFVRRISELMEDMSDFTENALYIDKFKKFLVYKPNIETYKGKTPPSEDQPIRFENISFTYSGAKEASLKNINMTIKPKEKIAIVGYNGAGKSTLIKLLLRLYDTSEGHIYYGNDRISDYTTDQYREKFGTVFQDFQIFAASLAENVAMRQVEENELDDIEKVLNVCGLKEKIETLPKGIESQLTKEYFEDGINLSGGEAQKVAIARAFYGDFPYIIMDEPSSALDPISEYHLNEMIMELGNDKTVIFISHRLSTTVMADKIYMFEKGEIIEEGDHESLMALDGKYAEMFKVQGQYYQEEYVG